MLNCLRGNPIVVNAIRDYKTDVLSSLVDVIPNYFVRAEPPQSENNGSFPEKDWMRSENLVNRTFLQHSRIGT
jgi:hypothetical protein